MAKLPPIELLEATHAFPCAYISKLSGKPDERLKNASLPQFKRRSNSTKTRNTRRVSQPEGNMRREC